MPALPDHVADRLPNKEALSEQLTTDTTIPGEVTVAEVETAIAEVDVAQAYADESAAWEVEVWDRTSPINGVPAEDVLARRDDIPEKGDVVLIRNAEGDVVMFQPHDPEQEGFVAIPKGKGEARGGEMAEEIVTSRVAEHVREHVANKIRQDREKN